MSDPLPRPASSPPPAYSIPIVDRPKPSKLRSAALLSALFVVFLFMHISQLILLPLSFIPGGLREGFWSYIQLSKASVGGLLVFLSRGTVLRISVDDSIDPDTIWQKNKEGAMTLKLDERSLFVSNHQNYADWIYLWAMFYFSDLASAVHIVLKASLKWIPIVGYGMQLFEFIFLDQSPKSNAWEKSDRAAMGKILKPLARRAEKYQKPLALLLFPEGTLFSSITQPKSAKYAEKIGVPNLRNLLIPRSTGTLFALRALASEITESGLYDVTIAYPGMTTSSFAQTYYSLSSIFVSRCRPPVVHLHLRHYPMATIPIGHVPAVAPRVKDPHAYVSTVLKRERTSTVDELEAMVKSEDRAVFDEWLRERWTEKDELLEGYYREGQFKGKSIEIPIKLRGIDDYLTFASNFVTAYSFYRLLKYLALRYLF